MVFNLEKGLKVYIPIMLQNDDEIIVPAIYTGDKRDQFFVCRVENCSGPVNGLYWREEEWIFWTFKDAEDFLVERYKNALEYKSALLGIRKETSDEN